VSFSVDTNFVVSILFVDAHTERAFAWLARNRAPLLISDWVATELLALVQRCVRTGLLSGEIAAAAMAEFDAFARTRAESLRLSPGAGLRAAGLARDAALKLSAADALHLALSAEGDHCLVTFDTRLADAAKARGFAFDTP
jgi:predicted nucleic acid-binding protein